MLSARLPLGAAAQRANSMLWDRPVSEAIDDRQSELAKLAQACVNMLAKAMDERWGSGRLPMIVSAELRARFLKQQRLYHEALMADDETAIVAQSHGMLRAWHAIDDAAVKAGEKPLPWSAWQLTAPTGEVVTIIREKADLALVPKQPGVEVWTADAIVDLIINQLDEIREDKRQWPKLGNGKDPVDWKEGDDIPF